MRHGGDIYLHDVDMDYSVNLNPCAEALWKTGREAIPGSLKAFESFREDFARIRAAGYRGLENADRYPDYYCRALKKHLSILENIPEEQILCGNGASEIFMAIVHALRPKKSLLLVPCYSGYEYVLHACGCRTVICQLKEENGFQPAESLLDYITEELDMFFLAHPNNPTGKLVDPLLLLKIAEKCRTCNVRLVLDACFYPLAARKTEGICCTSSDSDSSCQLSGNTSSEPENCLPSSVLVVKAFTKTMAIPGLRLGYLIVKEEDLRNDIAAQFPEWNVSGIAQEVGTAAAKFLSGSDFMEKSASYIANEREFLRRNLIASGYPVFPSDVNYLLFRPGRRFYQLLLNQRILVRDCSGFPGLAPDYCRIAVRTREENERLIERIRKL